MGSCIPYGQIDIVLFKNCNTMHSENAITGSVRLSIFSVCTKKMFILILHTDYVSNIKFDYDIFVHCISFLYQQNIFFCFVKSLVYTHENKCT
jgi:hypothetical protein